MNIRQRKFFDKHIQHDPQFITVDGCCVPDDAQKRIAEKIQAAKDYLGRKWIAHPANQVQRKPDMEACSPMFDSATKERQAFIRCVK